MQPAAPCQDYSARRHVAGGRGRQCGHECPASGCATKQARNGPLDVPACRLSRGAPLPCFRPGLTLSISCACCACAASMPGGRKGGGVPAIAAAAPAAPAVLTSAGFPGPGTSSSVSSGSSTRPSCCWVAAAAAAAAVGASPAAGCALGQLPAAGVADTGSAAAAGSVTSSILTPACGRRCKVRSRDYDSANLQCPDNIVHSW